MSERLKYVSEKYQDRLDRLAELLVTQRRFGQLALTDEVQLELNLDGGLQDTVEFNAIDG